MKTKRVFSALFAFILAFANDGIFIAGQPAAPRYDLVIINGRIIDGTGNPWFRGSIGIKDGRIARVGRIDASEGSTVIDAKSQIVAPGFIDVHVHTEDIFENPTAENFIRMGVTSLVTGNCG